MKLILILLLITYTALIIIMFGITTSYSRTYYLLKEKKDWLKYLFVIFTASYGYISIMYFQHILIFFAGSFLMAVSASPLFDRDETTKKLHMIGASGSSIFLFAYMIVKEAYFVYIPALVLCGLVLLFKKRFNGKENFWLELVAFATILLIH